MSTRNLIFTLICLLHSKCRALLKCARRLSASSATDSILCAVKLSCVYDEILLTELHQVLILYLNWEVCTALSVTLSRDYKKGALLQLVDRRVTSEWDFLVAIYVSLLSPTHTPASMSSANYAVLLCQEMEVEWKFINRTEEVNSPFAE